MALYSFYHFQLLQLQIQFQHPTVYIYLQSSMNFHQRKFSLFPEKIYAKGSKSGNFHIVFLFLKPNGSKCLVK